MNSQTEMRSPFRGLVTFQYPPVTVSSCSYPPYARLLPSFIMFCRFGGYGGSGNFFNDTWSFNVSARKWTKLQCTGSIPSPRSSHAAVLVGDVMYVFGGISPRGTGFGNLAALNLSSE